MYPDDKQPGASTPGQPAPQQPADPPQQMGQQPQVMPPQTVQPAQPAVPPVEPGVVSSQSQMPGAEQPYQPQPFAGAPADAQGPTQPNPYSAAPMPSYSMQQAMPGSSGSKKRLVFALIAVVVAVGLGVGAYFLLGRNSDTADKTNKAATKSGSTTKAKSLGTLHGVTFNAPSLDGYELNSSSTDTAKIYRKGDCSLQFGTTDEKNLPGNNLGEIVDKQISALKDSNVSIIGPDAGDALILKAASDSSKEYSMPTLVFNASRENQHLLSRYSVVVFTSGQRAFVTRACLSNTQPVSASAVDEVDKDAKRITVTPQ